MRQHLQGHGFDPETARLLGLAFEMALVALQHADRVVSPTRDAVAQKIIEVLRELVSGTRGVYAMPPWKHSGQVRLSPTSVLFRLTLHRRRSRILELEPVG